MANALSTPTPSSSSGGCVKAKIVGNATTYDPTKAGGWKSGGLGLSTGGTYNPNGWEAALQIDFAKQYGCGYGSGKVCHAVVEGNGKSMIVKINDNGPMCADSATARHAPDCTNPHARVIDLNTKSMQYLGGGSGLVKNVTVTILCDFNNTLGPLDEKERQEWISRVFNTPAASAPVSSSGLSSSLTGISTFGNITSGLSNNPFSSPFSNSANSGTPSGSSYAQPSYEQPSYTASASVQPTSYFPAYSGSSGTTLQGTAQPTNTLGGVVQPNSTAGNLLALLQNPSNLNPLTFSSASPGSFTTSSGSDANVHIVISTQHPVSSGEGSTGSTSSGAQSVTTVTVTPINDGRVGASQTFSVGNSGTSQSTQSGSGGVVSSTLEALSRVLSELMAAIARIF